MEILQGMLIVVVGILFIISCRSITTLFHELGHAIPALLFGKEPVHIYVGSYGNPKGSLKLKLGRLTAFLKISFLDWNLGVCQWKKTGRISFIHNFIVTLGGPLMSLIIAGIAFVMLLQGGSDMKIALLAIVSLSAFWDFLVNMIPWNRPIYLEEGLITFNDGKSLMNLLATRNMTDEMHIALDKMNQNDFAGAQADLEEMMAQGNTDKSMYYSLIKSCIGQKKYEDALSYFRVLKSKNHKLEGSDYALIGAIYFEQNKFLEAQKFLDQAIYYTPNDIATLFKRAKNEVMLGDYNLAIKDLNAILARNPKFPGVLATRAELFLKQDDLTEAEDDITHALSINAEDPHTQFVAGLVYREKGENKTALAHFIKAQELGSTHHGLPFFIDQMRA